MGFDISVPCDAIRERLAGWEVAVAGNAIVAVHQGFGAHLLAIHIVFDVYPALVRHIIHPVVRYEGNPDEITRRAADEHLAYALEIVDQVMNPPLPEPTPEELEAMAWAEYESERTLREAERLGPDGWRVQYQSWPDDPRDYVCELF